MSDILDKSETNSEQKNCVVLENITKIYEGGVPTKALDDVSLSLGKGTLNAMIGQSGSGKTTLMNLIAGLDKPSSGTITVNGHNLIKLPKEELARFRNTEIGLVFQSHYLLPEFNVAENILLPHRIGGEEIDEAILAYMRELLQFINLEKYEKSKIYELSGGQQQRVAIARALINRPSILLADEPGASLDSKLTKQVFQLLEQLNRKYRMTVLVITHKETLSGEFPRIIELQDGRIVSDTT